MQKNYVNATLMLRLSLDRCQEIQSYGSHSNYNLATPLLHFHSHPPETYWAQTVQQAPKCEEAVRGRNCTQDILELLQMQWTLPQFFF